MSTSIGANRKPSYRHVLESPDGDVYYCQWAGGNHNRIMDYWVPDSILHDGAALRSVVAYDQLVITVAEVVLAAFDSA